MDNITFAYQIKLISCEHMRIIKQNLPPIFTYACENNELHTLAYLFTNEEFNEEIFVVFYNTCKNIAEQNDLDIVEIKYAPLNTREERE